MSQPSPAQSLASALFSLKGRLGRREFTVGFLGLIVASTVFALGTTAVVGRPPLWAWNLLQVIVAWPLFALMVKRGHDRGRSALWTLGVNVGAHVAPMILLAAGRREGAFWVWAVLAVYIVADYWFAAGQPQDNQYGVAAEGPVHAHYVA